MGSLESAQGEEEGVVGGGRPSRKAAAKAALAIKSEAQDNTNDIPLLLGKNNSKKKPTGTGDNDYNAFAEIMSNRSRANTKATTKPSQPSRSKKTTSSSSSTATTTTTTTTTTSATVDTGNSTTSVIIPDLEDLVTDAAKVRISKRHSQSHHRFTTEKSRQRVHNDLLAWFDIHHRKLPWRRDFHGPKLPGDERPGQRAYEVWVSEIMCQQTQIATVIPYFNTWMAKWPTIADLAAADLEEVNKVWTGLGYYSRASRLHSGAQKVLKDFNGVLPSDPSVLEKEVPGIGRYTAGAIASHAYNVPAELVDGNVIRVLSRLRAIGGDVKSPKVIDLHWQIAKELVHQERPGCFNQGLMELGAMVCTPQNPKCDECPLQTSCRAYAETLDLKKSRQETIGASQKRSIREDDDEDSSDTCTLCLAETEVEGKDLGLVTQYPRKAAKKAPRDEECAVSILERRRKSSDPKESVSEFLLVKRPDKGLLAGMWEFPTVEQDQLQGGGSSSSSNSKMQKSTPSSPSPSPSTYKQRSEASRRYLEETLQLDWIKDCKNIQRRDLGSVQHLFSHIRKVYHVEWVLVKDIVDDSVAHKEEGKKDRKKKSAGSLPETEWLTAEELATAAIPTGINKTFQLLQKYKAGAGKNDNDDDGKDDERTGGSGGSKRRKAADTDGGVVKDKIKKVKKEDGLLDISKFFKAPSK
ncbi:hypothetical protein BGX26_009973 [Mortierella sp. AD094]|nr:hypothetical protein BGX26_009973 [Mortierella sp. AD094]